MNNLRIYEVKVRITNGLKKITGDNFSELKCNYFSCEKQNTINLIVEKKYRIGNLRYDKNIKINNTRV